MFTAVRGDSQGFSTNGGSCLVFHLTRRPEAKATVEAVQDFLQAFYPKRSQFELEHGFRNRFLHVADLREWQHQQKQVCCERRIGDRSLLLAACHGCTLIRYLVTCRARLSLFTSSLFANF